VTPCRSVSGFRHFEGTFCHHQESRGLRRLFDHQGQGTDRSKRREALKNATFVCPKCVAFLDCAAVILLRSTVLQGVVVWFLDWLVGWLCGCVIGWLVGCVVG